MWLSAMCCVSRTAGGHLTFGSFYIVLAPDSDKLMYFKKTRALSRIKTDQCESKVCLSETPADLWLQPDLTDLHVAHLPKKPTCKFSLDSSFLKLSHP